ncbi:MAG: metal-dependent transcriptional regulator [Acidobacteria bacterium]|nr:metal-dependent transcriptional regulator [Acidobacteriota bacterium]
MTAEQSASMEDYLEAVEILHSKGIAPRVKEISALLGVKMPSVTAAMKRLSEEKMVVYERYGWIKLTSAGKKAAKDIFRRHEVLRQFLVEVLDMDPKTAAEDACRMEHAISSNALERFARFLSYVEYCSNEKMPWLSNYRRYLKHGQLPNKSEQADGKACRR